MTAFYDPAAAAALKAIIDPEPHCCFPHCRCEWQKREEHCPAYGGTTKGYEPVIDRILAIYECPLRATSRHGKAHVLNSEGVCRWCGREGVRR